MEIFKCESTAYYKPKYLNIQQVTDALDSVMISFFEGKDRQHTILGISSLGEADLLLGNIKNTQIDSVREALWIGIEFGYHLAKTESFLKLSTPKK